MTNVNKNAQQMELYLHDTPGNPNPSSSELYDLVRSRRSLADTRTSLWQRPLIGFLILGSLGVKLYSLVVFFARMKLEVHLLTPTHKIPLVSQWMIDFSFPEMVRDFWTAKAYFVAVVIVIGSCVVPIAKHVCLFLAWVVPIPPEWEGKRRLALLGFDVTGRTALVDLFLLGYVVCIFYTNVVKRVDGYGVEITMSGQPVRGLFLGVLSTFTAAFLNHLLLLAHDGQKLGDFTRQVTVASGPPTASLVQRLYASPKSLRFKHLANFTVIALLISSLSTLISIVWGGFELVSFHLEGLAGAVADEGWRYFDLLTAAENMPHNTDEVNGARFLSGIYIAIVLVVPIMLVLVAATLWFVPLHIRPQRRVLTLFPFWFSWCSLDVMFITSIASYMEMHLIAEFTFDKKFHTLCNIVRDVLETPCVALGHESGTGMYVLALCCLLYLALSFIVAKLGNSLLETASTGMSFDGSPAAEYFSPSWDMSSPLLNSGARLWLTSSSFAAPSARSPASSVGTPKIRAPRGGGD